MVGAHRQSRLLDAIGELIQPACADREAQLQGW